MLNYVLTCCSTVDISRKYLEKRNISFVSFNYHLDGKSYLDDLGESVSFDDYYEKIKEGSMPTTSQVNVGQFLEFFETFLRDEKDILHISFSSGLSGSYNSAIIASEELKIKYPNRKILVVDSLAASSGYGLLVDKAADLRDSGESIEDIHKFIEQNKLNVNHWFFSTDLTHYKRGGRISSTSAAVGTLLNINPLLNMNCHGELTPVKKVRGKKKVINEMIEKMTTLAKDGVNYSGKCFISHSASFNDARMLADLIEEKFKSLDGSVVINNIGMVIGAHTGPGTVALFFFGDERKC